MPPDLLSTSILRSSYSISRSSGLAAGIAPLPCWAERRNPCNRYVIGTAQSSPHTILKASEALHTCLFSSGGRSLYYISSYCSTYIGTACALSHPIPLFAIDLSPKPVASLLQRIRLGLLLNPQLGIVRSQVKTKIDVHNHERPSGS